LSAAAGFIGMNVAVRSNSRTAEAARKGLGPALNVAFRAGSVTGLLVVGLGLFGVTGYYWFLTGALHNSPVSAIDDLVGLAIGGVSAVASVIGTYFARLGRGPNAVINALYKAVLVATVLSALGFIPIMIAFDKGPYGFGDLYSSALVGLVVTFLLVAITEYYTGTRWNPVKEIAKASQTGHATNIIEGLAVGMQATAAPVIVIVAGILVAQLFTGGLMPFLFASLAMQAVGRVGGEVVQEVRRQFREHPGIMERTERPDYSRAVGIVTGSAIKSMLAPALIPIGFPIVVGIINARMLGGLLIGTIVTG